MAVPVITSVEPTNVPAGGNVEVSIHGTGFNLIPDNGISAQVLVDGWPVDQSKVGVYSDTLIKFTLPPLKRHARADVSNMIDGAWQSLPIVDVEVRNLDSNGDVIPGEVFIFSDALQYERFAINYPNRNNEEMVYEAVTKELMRVLMMNVHPNVSLFTSVDYGEFGLSIHEIARSQLPAIALQGPNLAEDLEARHMWHYLFEKDGTRNWPARVATVGFEVVIGSDNTSELLGLVQAIITGVDRTPFLAVHEVTSDYSSPKHEFPLVMPNMPSVQPRTQNDNLYIATCTLEVLHVPMLTVRNFREDASIGDAEMRVSNKDGTVGGGGPTGSGGDQPADNGSSDLIEFITLLPE